MPELPELEVLKENLLSQIRGKKVRELKVLKPYILKNYFVGDLSGEKIENINRRGKYLIIKLSKHKIIVHLMLRGSITYVLPGTKLKKPSAAVVNFEDGTVLELSETGHKKRMSIFVLPKKKIVGKFGALGIEPLQDDFAIEKLKNLLHSENRQVKSFLCSQKKIVGIGNAYADEILWSAQLSPFKMTRNLNARETERLHASIISVLQWAIKHVREKGIQEKRDFLQVHGKKGKPCPRCGEPIQCVSFTQSETSYCPSCQTGGRKLKDRRMSKFYR
jgi:formamidopyrimidine-DNA glycosylase